ncbi:MAG: hypothetical protein DRJ65_17330, partial [Acidobacteria bacterium]
MTRRLLGLSFWIVVALGVAGWGGTADQSLLFHAESLGGDEVVASQGADQPFNPASVIKVATSL